MLKVIEVLAESEKSWEDATAQAVADSAKTVKNIKSCYIQEFSTVVKDNKVVKYRVNAKISFELSDR